jgi:UDP-N-acetylglucosamine 2-epimerase (non-hydrolysing)
MDGDVMKRKNKIKTMVVFGTRPEVIKTFPVIRELKNDQKFVTQVVSTAQHRQMVDDLLDLFSIHPDYDLNIMRPNQSLTDICRNALSGLDPILGAERPDIVLVQGDTTTAFVTCLAAFYRRIPVGHIEAGLRSYDRDHPYPEEINRRLISVACEMHLAPTTNSAMNLLKEGIDANRVYVTGNTVVDALLHIARNDRKTLNNYLNLEALSGNRMMLVTAHRRENWGKPLEELCYGLRNLVEKYHDVYVVYPVHLNPNVRKSVFRILDDHDRILLLDPLPYEPFVEAMNHAYLIITDSGGIQEEAPALHKPVLVFRKVTERTEGVEQGGVKLIGLKRDNVAQEASMLLDDVKAYREMIMENSPYGDGEAGKRVVQALKHFFGLGKKPEPFQIKPRREYNNAITK